MREDLKNKISEKIWQIMSVLFMIFVTSTCLLTIYIVWRSQNVPVIDNSIDGINGYAYSFVPEKEVSKTANVKLPASYTYRDNSHINHRAKNFFWRAIHANAKEFFLTCTPKHCGYNSFGFDKDEIWAVEFDLDDDGEKEILASYYDMSFMRSIPIFIYKKIDGKYVNILRAIIGNNLNEIRILYSKTNGYHDIEVVLDDWYIEGKRHQAILKFQKTFTESTQTRDENLGYKYNFSLNDTVLTKNRIIDGFDMRIGGFETQSVPAAEKILRSFLSDEIESEFNKKPDEAFLESLGVRLEATSAVFVDLNDDGKLDVLGTNNCSHYMGTVAGGIYMLINKGGKFVNYGYDLINTDCTKILILKNKTNGLHDIGFYCGYDAKNKTRIMQFR